MLVVTFSATGALNCVTIGDSSFVYAQTEHGSFVLPVNCPHRGGPLHLATLEPGRLRLVCPWHGRATSISRLLKRGLPAVRHGNLVTVVFPGSSDLTYRLGYRPISAGLAVR